MSADNWATCPRCVENAGKDRLAKQVEAESLYGKVPLDEYNVALANIPEQPHPLDFQTFREDYEFYNDGTGTVVVTYSGHCKECGLEHDFETTLHLL